MSADILTRFLRQPDINCKETNRIRDLLKLPDRNHAPIDRAFLQKPLIDRWLVDGRGIQLFSSVFFEPPSEGPLTFQQPTESYCIVLGGGEILGSHSCAFVKQNNEITFFVSYPKRIASKYNLGFVAVGCLKFHSQNGWRYEFFHPTGATSESLRIVNLFRITLLMINNHRVAATRQVIRRNEDNPADRAAMQRAMQRGAPWYSHNVATLRRPGTAEFRGVILDSESMGAPKRQHLVAGHWRLVELHKDENGDLCPYWTWVEGHLRGSIEAGRIEKSRIVEMSAASEVARKGYLKPSGPGAPGARMKATPAQASDRTPGIVARPVRSAGEADSVRTVN